MPWVCWSRHLLHHGLDVPPDGRGHSDLIRVTIIVTALSFPILGEVVGWRRWSAVAVSLLGVPIVVRPGAGVFGTAAVFPVLSTFSWAAALVVTRKKSSADNPLVSLTFAAVVGLLITSALVSFTWVTPRWREIGLEFMTGGASTIAQWLVVLAFQQARASVLAPFSCSQLVWSGMLGYMIFGDVPDGWTLLGATVIIASGLLHGPSRADYSSSICSYEIALCRAGGA